MRTSPTLAATSHGEFHATASVVDRASSLLRHAAERTVQLIRGRRVLRTLAALSDHELRDIGLTRHDLDTASILPLSVDPSAVLGSMVHERDRLRSRLR
jgi:uncharacterized protein YjiS (DUF1127 family)